MRLKTPYMLIVFGPTAVGKTDFALQIAHHLPAEIINMDMGQFYTPLSIGTAKPDWKLEKNPHHLFDIVDEPRNISVTEYRERLMVKLNEIWDRGSLPILVGGSGFYLRSIFFPPVMESTAPLLEDDIAISNQELWQNLYNVDAMRAEKINPQDRYRVRRALAIWQATGKKPSTMMPLYEAPSPFTLLLLTRDRKDLYDRINQRTSHMIHAGWIQETKMLLGTGWEEFLMNKKIIGYNDIISFLHEAPDESRDALIEIIAQRTRNYAKRQFTFWNSLEKDLRAAIKLHQNNSLQPTITSIDLTLLNHDLYINQLIENLTDLFNDN